MSHRHKLAIGGIEFQAFPVEHSLFAPAVAYRIRADGADVFYAPSVLFFHEPRAGLSGVHLYIGDRATIHRRLVRRRETRLLGHASIATQLTWGKKLGMPRAIITHCESGMVSDETRAAEVRALDAERDVALAIAHDGMTRRV